MEIQIDISLFIIVMQYINSTFFKHKYKQIYLRIYYLYNHDMSILGIFNLKKVK